MAAGSGFVVVDYSSASETTPPAGADGICLLEIEAPGSEWWRISRVTVTNTSLTQTQALIYEGSIDASNFVDGTRTGGMGADPVAGDVGEYPNPIPIPGGVSLIIRWSACTLGAWGIARVTYEILQRGEPPTRPLLG